LDFERSRHRVDFRLDASGNGLGKDCRHDHGDGIVQGERHVNKRVGDRAGIRC